MKETMNQLGKEKIPFLFILDFELEKPVIIPLSLVDNSIISYNISGNTNDVPGANQPVKDFYFHKKPISRDIYLKAFFHVVNMEKTGYSYLANLTFPSEIETNLGLNDIYNYSHAPYKLYYKDEFTVFSPESFVKIQNGIIRAFPMKGTIDAAMPDAETKILRDPKETAEHATIVDLIRNDISMVAHHVQVVRYRYMEKILTHEKEIIQVSSEIEGQLPPGYHEIIGDIMFSLLPAGSISGAPKQKTIEIIREAEKVPRGYYTGVLGIFDGTNLDSGVMIRFVEKKNKKLYFRSGGGITTQSDPNVEYQELIDKIYVPFR
ncbi:MAG: aminodeoxychorismate synthase component I [bacterium]